MTSTPPPPYNKKWNAYPKQVIPLWVADMDFPAPPGLSSALAPYLAARRFGYSTPPPTLNAAIKRWTQERYQVTVAEELILPLVGMVPALHLILGQHLRPDEKYLVFTPIYPPLVHFSKSLAREVVEQPLVNSGGRYEIDFSALKKRLSAEQGKIKALLLCNPHNPTGTVWTAAELEALLALSERYQFLLLSDEIWADFCFAPSTFTSLARYLSAAPERLLALLSPGKTFSLPEYGLPYLLTHSPTWHRRLANAARFALPAPTPMHFLSLQQVYTHEAEWLVALKKKLLHNRNFAVHFIQHSLPSLAASPGAATHLLWIDCSAAKQRLGNETAFNFFLKQAQVALSCGTTFGLKTAADYRWFVRLNFACERPLLEAALVRMRQALSS